MKTAFPRIWFLTSIPFLVLGFLVAWIFTGVASGFVLFNRAMYSGRVEKAISNMDPEVQKFVQDLRTGERLP